MNSGCTRYAPKLQRDSARNAPGHFSLSFGKFSALWQRRKAYAEKQYIERLVAVEQPLLPPPLQNARRMTSGNDREDEAEHTERVKHTLAVKENSLRTK